MERPKGIDDLTHSPQPFTTPIHSLPLFLHSAPLFADSTMQPPLSLPSDAWDAAMGLDIPFIRLLGFELKVVKDGQSELHYVPQAAHLNSFDITHGGALMTLLDAAMAMAARSYEMEMGVVTVEMKTSFMQPAVGPLTAKGELMHRTPTLGFTQATVYNQAGRVCAHATGTFKYIKRLPVGRTIADLVAMPAGEGLSAKPQ
jgi:uncharacterized protein (TIGR00369 family)